MRYRNDDPPDYGEEPIALKCCKCGRFVKTTPVRFDSTQHFDSEGEEWFYDSWGVYNCSKCGEIPEGKLKGIFA